MTCVLDVEDVESPTIPASHEELLAIGRQPPLQVAAAIKVVLFYAFFKHRLKSAQRCVKLPFERAGSRVRSL